MKRRKTPSGIAPEAKIIKRRRLRFKFKPGSLLLLILIASVLYHLGLGLFGLVVNYCRLEEQKKKLQEKTDLIQMLEMQKDRWHEEEFLEKEARKLGLVKEEETPVQSDPETQGE